MWGIMRKRSQEGRKNSEKLWHDLLSEFTEQFGDKPFFGGEKPDLIDLAAFGYVRSISPYSQFSQLEDHEAGMNWYRAVEATLKV